MAFPTSWTRQHAIQSDPDKVSGTANLTNFPSLLTEANFNASIFSNSQGKEASSNFMLSGIKDDILQGYYKLEDVTDDSGNSYDLTNVGTTTFTTGKFGNAATFDGSTQALYNSSTALNFGSSPLTYSCWIKRTDTFSEIKVAVQERTSTSGQKPMQIQVNSTDHRIRVPVDGVAYYSTSAVPLNEWVHIAFVVESNTSRKIYVNGVLENTITASYTHTTTNMAGISIGRNDFTSGTGNYFKGQVDDVLILNGALNAAEVKSIYAGGADLRFTTDEAGTNQIPHEVVNWDIDNSEAEVWVKIPTLSYNTATTIYVWANNSSATPLARNDTYGSDNVWGSSYKGVWHTQNNFADSTVSNYNLTAVNSPTFADSQIGKGADFEVDISQYASIADASAPNLEISGSQTWQAWIKPETMPQNGRRVMGKRSAGKKSILFATNTYPRFELAGLTTNESVTSLTSCSAGSWYSIYGVYDSANSKLKIFVNGTKAEVTASGTPTDTNDVFSLGAEGSNGQYYDGILDEARIYSGALSDDWISTEYNNQNSPATFWIELTNYTDELTDTITLADSISRGVTYNRGTVSAITLADNVDRYSIYTRNISTEGSNIILNPSFEDGDIDNWTLNGGGVTVVQKSSTYANSGTYSLRVLSISPISSANGESDYTNVSSSTTYNLSFYCRKDISDSNATYRVIGYDSGDNPTDLISTTAINTTAGSFVQVTDTFTTASDTVKIKVFLAVTTSTGDIYYDDVSVFQEGSDTISVTDNIDYEYTAGTIIRSLLSSLTITDNLDRQINYIREQLSGLTATDTINRQQNSIRGLINTLTLADNIDNSVLSLFLVNLSSSLSIGDNIDKTTSYSKQLLEAINVAENLVRNVDYSRVLSGSITITDSLDFVNLLSRELTSALSIGDNLDRVLNINVTLSDGISLDDALDTQNTLNRSIESSLILGDNIDATIVLSRSLTSGITVADNLDFTFVINRDLSDTITLTDTIDRVARYIGKSIASIGEIDTIKPTIQGVEKTKGTTYKIDKDRPILYSIRKG